MVSPRFIPIGDQSVEFLKDAPKRPSANAKLPTELPKSHRKKRPKSTRYFS